jgi:hypothetical protein
VKQVQTENIYWKYEKIFAEFSMSLSFFLR